MAADVQITLRGLLPSAVFERRVHQKVAKLESLHPGVITRCRVVAEQPHHHQRRGAQFVVRLDIAMHGREIVVNREHNEDIYVALRDAFNGARRQLDAWAKPEVHAVRGRGAAKAEN